ncbi:unnamed protein product [Prorocentrum cordatum]|uniref:Uncharacterized protein n=1 Tax=Prorocentrum cordatum TaxID=2364126 RepID=A0ABN9QL43_9DINO|nr:unnamed protein product [Polarella glacialis]
MRISTETQAANKSAYTQRTVTGGEGEGEEGEEKRRTGRTRRERKMKRRRTRIMPQMIGKEEDRHQCFNWPSSEPTDDRSKRAINPTPIAWIELGSSPRTRIQLAVCRSAGRPNRLGTAAVATSVNINTSSRREEGGRGGGGGGGGGGRRRRRTPEVGPERTWNRPGRNGTEP